MSTGTYLAIIKVRKNFGGDRKMKKVFITLGLILGMSLISQEASAAEKSAANWGIGLNFQYNSGNSGYGSYARNQYGARPYSPYAIGGYSFVPFARDCASAYYPSYYRQPASNPCYNPCYGYNGYRNARTTLFPRRTGSTSGSQWGINAGFSYHSRN